MKRLKIKTKRLIIRNLTSKDLAHFYAYRSSPEVMKYQGSGVMTKEEAQQFIEKQADKQFGKAGEWVQYGIENRATGQLIGDCAIHLRQATPDTAEIGITISSLWQKQGYAKEALLGILRFLFEANNIRRVVERLDAENIASKRLLESIGFRKEGHFVETMFFKNEWISEFQYAMLKKEWEEFNG